VSDYGKELNSLYYSGLRQENEHFRFTIMNNTKLEIFINQNVYIFFHLNSWTGSKPENHVEMLRNVYK
jgi:hypothetical protein